MRGREGWRKLPGEEHDEKRSLFFFRVGLLRGLFLPVCACMYPQQEMSSANLNHKCFGEGLVAADLHAKWVSRIKSEHSNPKFPKMWVFIKQPLAKHSLGDRHPADHMVQVYDGAQLEEEHDSDFILDSEDKGREMAWEHPLPP